MKWGGEDLIVLLAGDKKDTQARCGYSPGFADIAIAATARRHRLTILSRNKRHFAPMDLAVVDRCGQPQRLSIIARED